MREKACTCQHAGRAIRKSWFSRHKLTIEHLNVPTWNIDNGNQHIKLMNKSGMTKYVT